MIENVLYLRMLPDAGASTWLLRGCGTAVMHGGVTAIFAMVSKTLADWHGSARMWVYVPGFVVAWTLHSLFNHFLISPELTVAGHTPCTSQKDCPKGQTCNTTLETCE